VPIPKVKASFIEPMLCLSTESLPEGPGVEYELKLDGYRVIAFKTSGRVRLRSRNDKDFTARYPVIAEALRPMPDDTIIDGEIVAFDSSGRPSFNMLQNFGSSNVPVYYYAFDLPMLAGRDLTSMPLQERRELLQGKVLSKLAEPIRFSPTLDSTLDQLIRSVREQRFEGLIAKRKDSRYDRGSVQALG
jgi:ATP-dependent DNA ligase